MGRLIYKFFIFVFTPIWPIRAPFYIKRLTNKTNHIIEQEKIDIVVLIHIPIENLLVARKRKQNVIYVGYFLDLLVGGMKLSYMSEKTWEKKTKAVEKRVMQFLDYGIMMDSSRQLYVTDSVNNIYTDKLVFLDLPMLAKMESKQEDNKRTYFSEDDIVLLFVGSMANNVRDPHYILELFSRITNPKVKFIIVGNSDYYDDIKKFSSVDSRIAYWGRKSHEESVNMMKEADFLVNIGNNLQNMVPSKIFEYMSFKKPIISTYKVDNDPCLKPLEHYGMFLALDERVRVDINIRNLEQYIEHNSKTKIDDIRFRELSNRGGALYNNTPEAFSDFIDTLAQEVKI